MTSRELRRITVTAAIAVAVATSAVACSSSGTKQPTANGVPSSQQASGGPCGVLSSLMASEQSAIRDLQAGKISGPTAEATITGANGQLARASEAAGRSSVLGIALEQLVSENGTMASALNQSVPVANLGSVIATIQQDITNVENNCHT